MTNDLSDEEKRVVIIRVQRAYNAGLCCNAGTQDPLLFLHPNTDGTGSLTELWESEIAVLKTLLPTIETWNTQPNMTYEQQKILVCDDAATCWDTPGVNFTIMAAGITSPQGAVKAMTTFPTYRQLLDVLYENARHVEERQEQQQQEQQQIQQNIQQTQQFIQSAQNRTTMMLQGMGVAPTHYTNGVPHYNGGIQF